MEFGVCGGPDMAEQAVAAGFDYVEMSAPGFLKPLESKETFRKGLSFVTETRVRCPVVNCFVPGDMKITGPDVDLEALERYAANACANAEEAGVEVIVFGSGGARRIPDGFDRREAWRQLIAFCQLAGKHAEAHGVTIAIEPLNRAECNVLNSVAEAGALARETDHPAIKILVDAYHWAKDDQSLEAIITSRGLIAHTHIATATNRLVPGGEACDFAPFFRALKQAGYSERMSIEGQIPDPARDLPRALQLLRDEWCTAR